MYQAYKYAICCFKRNVQLINDATVIWRKKKNNAHLKTAQLYVYIS